MKRKGERFLEKETKLKNERIKVSGRKGKDKWPDKKMKTLTSLLPRKGKEKIKVS